MVKEKRMLKADPFKDLDVIDERAPRFNQGCVAVLTLVGIVFSAPWIFLLLALQFWLGLTFGRQYCPTCFLYFKVVQPIFGEGELEDSRPPRLANKMAFIFLLAASALVYAGIPLVGYIVAGMVLALATLASSTGLCVGCEIYKLNAKIRGKSGVKKHEIDTESLINLLNNDQKKDNVIIEFLHPLCAGCLKKEKELRDQYGDQFISINVKENKELAKSLGIYYVPTIIKLSNKQEIISLEVD